MATEGSAEATIRDIKRKTRRKYNAEEKIRIVIEGLRGEETNAELCRREGIAESLYYSRSKECMEAGKARWSGNTKRQASSSEVDELRQEKSSSSQRWRNCGSKIAC
jgi:transposase